MAITKKTINGHIKAMNEEGSTKRSIRVKTDMAGVYLVITNKGRCTWMLMYWFNSKKVSYSFGHYDNGGNLKVKLPILNERKAYDEAVKLKASIESGINVKEVADNKAIHEKELASLGILAKVDEFTVNDVFNYFIEKVAKKRWRENTTKNLILSYNKHVKPRLGDEVWDSVTFSEWRNLFDGIANGRWTGKASPAAARRMAKSMKQAFDEALYAEKVKNTDIKSIKLSRVAPAGKVKDRTLNEYELGQVWDWCEPCDTTAKVMARILLSTNARTHEVRVSQVQEWDLTTGVWTVPNEHSKNGERIVRPIPDHLADVIIMQIGGVRYASEGKLEREFNESRMMGKEYSHAGMALIMSDICHQLGMSKFTAHDLRRTCATLQHELGLDHVVIESLLGHRQDLVRRTYNHSTMLDSKREVLNKWYEYLEECKEKYLQINIDADDGMGALAQ